MTIRYETRPPSQAKLIAAPRRHEFYETDQTLTISIFDKGADPAQVGVHFEPRRLSYEHGDKTLVLEPLKGQIDPDASSFTVGKVKVEIRLVKRVHGRWGALVGDSPDALAGGKSKTKNWEGITTEILSGEKEKTMEEDPNVSGDSTLNSFFQKLYSDADEDTRRAMLKSFTESGGTTLSTNWDEVGKGTVEVKAPEGSEFRKWG